MREIIALFIYGQINKVFFLTGIKLFAYLYRENPWKTFLVNVYKSTNFILGKDFWAPSNKILISVLRDCCYCGK